MLHVSLFMLVVGSVVFFRTRLLNSYHASYDDATALCVVQDKLFESSLISLSRQLSFMF